MFQGTLDLSNAMTARVFTFFHKNQQKWYLKRRRKN